MSGLSNLSWPQFKGTLVFDARLAPYSWFRVGGPADLLFVPEDDADLAARPGDGLAPAADAAVDALRKALSMGGDAAIHINDSAIRGSDALATSAILAAAIRKLDYDLVITGMASTDGWVGVVPTMVAERLGLPAATLADELTLHGTTVTIRRDTDDDSRTYVTSLPCLVAVTDKTGEARYPSFKGIMAAKKKTVEQWTLADLGVAAGHSAVATAASLRPARAAGVKVEDDGSGAIKLADFLTERKFV